MRPFSREEGFPVMIDNRHLLEDRRLVIHGARCALGPRETMHASLQIAAGRITRILTSPGGLSGAEWGCECIDTQRVPAFARLR